MCRFSHFMLKNEREREREREKEKERKNERKEERRFVFRTKFHSAHILPPDALCTNANDGKHKMTLFACSFCLYARSLVSRTERITGAGVSKCGSSGSYTDICMASLHFASRPDRRLFSLNFFFSWLFQVC